MKKSFLFAVLCLLFTSSCKEIKASNEKGNTELSSNIPVVNKEAVYQDLEGNSIALSNYKGKRVLLNYWATWCKPCIEEMPSMERAQKLLEKEEYIFLFASDQSFEKILKFKERREFDLKFIKFNGNYADQNIRALPTTMIYNELGEQVERITGSVIWDAPEMIQKLKGIK